ncbi:MAG TPA: UDP-N-acetylglucosamine 2-epimerase [Gemmatimonadaceae bacterium]|nr:UDP-N-acetylglucosamine 2-epimerase [Gemmatimonadaceae bacterium]
MTRKICIVTGTRAEYGLLRWVMDGISKRNGLELQIVATGMHLSPEFGLTYRDIESDGFRIDRKVEMLLSSDTPVGLAKSMGLGLVGFGDVFEQLGPDIVVVLGDRFEIFAAAAAAMVARVPIAHLHGGEATEGLIDEPIRHAVTKMAHIHFVAAEEYRRRVIQLGEQPDRVFLVGGLGVDGIKRLPLFDRPALEESLDFRLGARNLLVTFHPLTLERSTSERQMEELLAALDELQDTHLIFTMPNADTDGRVLFDLIRRFVADHDNARAFASLGQLRYLSCVGHVDAVVGNSSSGLAEVPSFGKATVNIGDRQRGRLKAESVIDCPPERTAIRAAIAQVYTEGFQKTVRCAKNPYGDGGASERIVELLATVSLDDIVKKRFYDLAVE